MPATLAGIKKAILEKLTEDRYRPIIEQNPGVPVLKIITQYLELPDFKRFFEEFSSNKDTYTARYTDNDIAGNLLDILANDVRFDDKTTALSLAGAIQASMDNPNLDNRSRLTP
jgi:hypothetical protein